MRYLKGFLAVGISLVLLSCATSNLNKSNTQELLVDRKIIPDYILTSDDIIIYQYIVDSVIAEKNAKEVVVTDKTFIILSRDKTFTANMESDMSFLLDKEIPVSKYLFSSFSEVNKDIYIFSKDGVNIKNILWYSDVQTKISTDDTFAYRNILIEIAPDAAGILYFSRIGYNEDFTAALLQVRFNSGSSSGYSDYILLKKSEDKWSIVETVRLISY